MDLKRLTLKYSNILSENMLGEPLYLLQLFITDKFPELAEPNQTCTRIVLPLVIINILIL